MSLLPDIQRTACPTVVVEIFIGGPVAEVKRALAMMAADTGMCASVDETEFVYTGGREVGAVVRLINYPRFPAFEADISAQALDIAERLMRELGQASCSVVGPRETVWISRRSA